MKHSPGYGKTVHWVVAFVVCGSALSHGEDMNVEFNRQIRPILSDKCFACHGPDEGQREGGFRLDEKAAAFAEADSGERPIVAGDLAASAVFQRITSQDDDARMPPPDSNKSLSAEQIDLIRRWIEQGANWDEHWSFVVRPRPELPAVPDEWVRNEIDRFILARLTREGLQPAPEADKETLIRRVTFDLTGLPPSLDEIDAYLADGSPRAYEKVVDRLLRSSAYGEHMARFWLDAARYGDTHGLHLDNYREMWPYRDWVVQAFHRNMPYDQFVIEQIAGDLLPEPSLDQQVATGFIRCNISTNEGGSIEEEVYVRNVVDRVMNVGTVMMGLTLECSRCHDHKYDPFTMHDFYSLFAFFNSIDGNPLDGNKKDHAPVVHVPNEAQRQQLAEYDRLIKMLQHRLEDDWPELDGHQAEWEQRIRQSIGETRGAVELGNWYTVGPFTALERYLNGKKQGPEGKPVHLDERFNIPTGEVGWANRADWADETPHSLPGESAANFLYRQITADVAQPIVVSLGSDDGIKVYLNNEQVLEKFVRRSVAPDQEQLELDLKQGQNDLLIKIINYEGNSGFYFAARGETAPLPKELLEIVAIDSQQRSAEQRVQLREFFRHKVSQSAGLKVVKTELARYRQARTEIERRLPTTLVWRERKDPKAAYYLNRGEYDQRGEEVARRTPLSLPPMDPDLPLNRLGLAKWIVERDHPLTARVAVNRFWQQVFGIGIVKTAEDFGSQGEPPSHPQLLDWLATKFVDSGWDVQALSKQIVMSATYRQSSRVTPELHQRDPENRLLARGPRFRLDAEMLRDQALFVSGLLVETLGGPSVKPLQPDGLWYAVGYTGSNTVRFVADKGSNKVHRRTLYTFIKRTAPPPQMNTFDAPSREASCVRRERTNTPLQALLLYNDPQFVEAARALAERTLRHGGDNNPSRAAFMFRLCTGRRAGDDELRELVAGVDEDLRIYQNNVDAAKQLIQVGDLPPDETLDASQLAAWTMTANMLLSLDEVVSKN